MKWKVCEPVDGGIVAVYPDTGKMEFPIAVKPSFTREDVWEEHAHLIAAAPDLLEALQEFLTAADAGWVPVEIDKKARAAITKATPEDRGDTNG